MIKKYIKSYSSHTKYYSKQLKSILKEKIPIKQKEAKELKEKHGSVVLQNCTIEMVIISI
jgi:hypothetical protein